MLPDWVSNPGPLTYESGALLIALRSPAAFGTMEISSRQRYFEPVRFDNSARSGGIIRISLIFYNMKAILMSTHNIPFSI